MATNNRRVGNLWVSMRADINGVKTDIKELDNAFKKGFQDIQTGAATAFKNVGISIAAAFSVTAIIGFTKGIGDLAGQLQDLQDQTGISGQLLSGLKSTLEENGTSIEAFAKGIFTAQKNLGQIKTDTDQAAIAIKSLGLNLDQLRNASPEQFLQLVAEALGKIDNPIQRAAAGAAILGRSFQALAPSLAQMAGRLEEMRAKGMNSETIKILDDFGDSITALNNALKIIVAGPLAGFVGLLKELFGLTSGKDKLIDELNDVSTKSLGIAANLAAVEARRAQGLRAGISSDERYNALLNERDKLLERSAQITTKLNQQSPPKPAQTPFVAPDTGKAATTTAAKKDTSAEDFIASLRKQADALRVSIVQLNQGADAATHYGLELEFAAFKSKLLADGKPIPPNLERDFGLVTAEMARLRDEAHLLKLGLETTADVLDKELGEALDENVKKTRAAALAQKDLEKAFKEMRIAAAGAAFDRDSEELGRMGEEAARFSEQFRAENFEKDWQNIESVIRSATGAIGTAFNGVIQGTQSIGEAFRNMGQSIALSLAAAINEIFIIQPLIDQLKRSLQGFSSGGSGTSAGGIFSSIAGAIGGAFGGGISGVSGGQFDFTGLGEGLGNYAIGGVVPGRIGAPRLAMVHGGETIIPHGGGGSSQPKVSVTINGDITPRQPNMTKDQVIQIGVEQFNNRGAWTQMYENRRSRD